MAEATGDPAAKASLEVVGRAPSGHTITSGVCAPGRALRFTYRWTMASKFAASHLACCSTSAWTMRTVVSDASSRAALSR